MKIICDWDNCKKLGSYKAPIEKDNSKRFKLLCLEHIKIFNKKWNYFSNMTNEEIEYFIKSDLTWQRPTQKFASSDNFFNILWNNALSDKFKIFKGDRYQITHEMDGHLNLMRNAVFADWDFPWHDLDIPTLVMTGFHDRVFFVNQDVLELSALIPNMKKIDFENAGHMIPMEQPKQFTDELLNFLSTL